MDPLDYLDRLLNEPSAMCPDCGGEGWYVHQSSAWQPPEQVPCDRCDANGYVPESELTEGERMRLEMAAEADRGICWPDEVGLEDEEETDDPDGLLDDGDDPDDGPDGLGVSS